MKFPEKCPECHKTFGMIKGSELAPEAYLIVRASLDYDKDEPDRIGDEILECTNCHTLFRARWIMQSFIRLMEMPTGFHDVEEFYKD